MSDSSSLFAASASAPPTLDELLAEAESDLVALDLRHAELLKELGDVNTDRGKLRRQVEALRELGARYAVKDVGGRLESRRADELAAKWRNLGRGEAVHRALVEMGVPAGPSEIVDYLVGRGRTDDRMELVSAALNYLKGRHFAERVAYGKWAAVETLMRDLRGDDPDTSVPDDEPPDEDSYLAEISEGGDP